MSRFQPCSWDVAEVVARDLLRVTVAYVFDAFACFDDEPAIDQHSTMPLCAAAVEVREHLDRVCELVEPFIDQEWDHLYRGQA